MDEARRQFERLAERQARPVAAMTMVGLIYEMQDHIQDARETYERVIDLDPRAAVAANNLASIYTEHGGNLDVALRLAQTAKAALPENAEVSDTLGWIYFKKELWPLAITTLRQAVEIDPGSAIFQYHLGMAYARSGDTVQARQSLQAALKLQPDFEGASDAARILATL
jgi:tetratricopeptide (TPR) repeat protein